MSSCGLHLVFNKPKCLCYGIRLHFGFFLIVMINILFCSWQICMFWPPGLYNSVGSAEREQGNSQTANNVWLTAYSPDIGNNSMYISTVYIKCFISKTLALSSNAPFAPSVTHHRCAICFHWFLHHADVAHKHVGVSLAFLAPCWSPSFVLPHRMRILCHGFLKPAFTTSACIFKSNHID